MFFKRIPMFFLPVLFLMTACATKHSEIVVAEFNDIPIKMEEFENNFKKNSGGTFVVEKDTLKELQRFLDLYVNYKMKLRDAVVRGYNNDPDVIKEINDYKANIGSAIYLEKNLIEPGIKKLYERRKKEYRASHIFLQPDSTRNLERTITFAKLLIDSLKNGASFDEFVRKYSKDTYTRTKGGDVYYFTAGQIRSTELEDAVYSAKVGEVYPEPVNSGMGVHIIKLTDMKDRFPSIRAQHILITLRDSLGKPVSDTAGVIQKIGDIKKRIDAGEDFGELAKEFSMDKGSAENKGDLGFFERGRMVKEFDEAAFKLNVGEVSPIIKTNYGFHIIKLLDKKSIPPFQEERESLTEIFQKTWYNKEYNLLIDKLKKEFNSVRDSSNIAAVSAKLDSFKIDSNYETSNFRNEFGNKRLLTVSNSVFTTDSLTNFMRSKKLNLGVRAKATNFEGILDQFESDILLKEKGMNYDKENTEFAKLMDDYKNGVYLFKILEKEVWSKITIDSNMVKDYWEKNKNNFVWKDRVELRGIFVTSDSLANIAYSIAQTGKNYDSLATVYNHPSFNGSVQQLNGLVDVELNELTRKANSLQNIGDISKPFNYQHGFAIVKLLNRDNARLKTYDEVKAEISGIIQDLESKRLESEYIERLNSIYKPVFYYDELQKAFKN